MLEEINIKNLGVIQSATLQFTPGLTVITGETGAGKTMVLSGLALLLGNRSSSNMIRHGEDSTVVEGCWNINSPTTVHSLQEVGAELEDGKTLYINRTVRKDGRSRAVVGGKSTPTAVLAGLGEQLVNIHGQSDQIKLKNSNVQRETLDSYAAPEITVALQTYQTLHSAWKQAMQRLEELQTNQQERQLQYETLLRTVEDINAVSPAHNEDVTLRQEAEQLENLEEVLEVLNVVSSVLNGDENGLSSLASRIKHDLSKIAHHNSSWSELLVIAETIETNINELDQNVAMELSNADVDAMTRLQEIQERIYELNQLIRKYGPTLDDVLQRWTFAEEKLESLNPANNTVEEVQKELAELHAQMVVAAKSLTNLRTATGKRLAQKVNAELAGLAMGNTKLLIEVAPTATFSSSGADAIQFMLQMPGGEPSPIGKTASGGELSRIMLALQIVLADTTTTPTFLFDEVDSGVGGSTALEIGKRLAALAKNAQVIVVSHLPQVAIYADNHLKVSKTSEESFSSTDVLQLSEQDRIIEVSRMLGGLNSSESGQAHAQEMLSMAAGYKTTLK